MLHKHHLAPAFILLLAACSTNTSIDTVEKGPEASCQQINSNAQLNYQKSWAAMREATQFVENGEYGNAVRTYRKMLDEDYYPINSETFIRSRIKELSTANAVLSDTGAKAITRIPPLITKPMLDKNMSGHCVLRFDVDKKGKLEKVEVEYCTNEKLFASMSLRSASLWKYAPKVVNNQAVIQTGLTHHVSFFLNEECGTSYTDVS